MLTSGGSGLLVETFGGKYRLLKKAKRKWDAISEHKENISNTEMKGGSLCLSRAQDHESVDGVDSKIVSLGKWAWIMQRATEMSKSRRTE